MSQVRADFQPRMLTEHGVQRFVDEPDGGEWLTVLARRHKRPSGHERFAPEEQRPVRTLHRCVELGQQVRLPFQYYEEQGVSEVVSIADHSAVATTLSCGYILRCVVVPLENTFPIDADSHAELSKLRDALPVVTRDAKRSGEETDYA